MVRRDRGCWPGEPDGPRPGRRLQRSATGICV